ncbi:glycosyltransferase family 2 protein [Aquihabitans sp. McL0605]|uniref:glycosyltransferase family 2 protein n=1 Tax=Aquihabitans sp. McL0605 TaxID=3415671 RepID=UPI003CEE4FC8
MTVDVTVIVAVRDGARYLPEALASVAGQSVLPAEVIVVDDGSTDGSGAVAAACAPTARVIVQPPSGYAAAVNRGVAAARSSLLAFLDADDLWSATSLGDRLDRLDRLAVGDPADIVVGATQNFLSPDLSDADASGIRLHERPFRAEVLAAAVVRADAFERVGPLDEDLRTGSAIDWMSRARHEQLAFAFVDALVLHRRIHASNLGRQDQSARNAELLQVVRAHHARLRPR